MYLSVRNNDQRRGFPSSLTWKKRGPKIPLGFRDILPLPYSCEIPVYGSVDLFARVKAVNGCSRSADLQAEGHGVVQHVFEYSLIGPQYTLQTFERDGLCIEQRHFAHHFSVALRFRAGQICLRVL